MPRSSTADEAERAAIAAMGNNLGKVYQALWQDVVHLHIKWAEYDALYGTKESRVALLNTSAPLFFRVVQDALWENVVLHVARLTDPPKSTNKDNLSITKLPDLISHQATKNLVLKLIDQAKKESEFCRDWRNRRLAHNDLALAIDFQPTPLAPATRAMMRQILATLCDTMNAVSRHYLKSTTVFGSPAVAVGGVDLLYVLDDGLKAMRDRDQRAEKGEYRPEDFVTRDL